MQNPSTNTLIRPPETDQPSGLSSEEEENSNRSNKKVKNSHIMEISLTDDSTPVEILDESMETLISEGGPTEVPQGKEVKMNDRTPCVELNHGIANTDCTKTGGGGDDPQPNRHKSYKDVVSNENQKDFVFNKDDDWSDEQDSQLSSAKVHYDKSHATQPNKYECEEKGIEAEEKYCATSLTSMIDFSMSKLRKKVNAISTEVEKETEVQRYTYYRRSRAEDVSLVGDDGTKVEAVAVCHEDTSTWNPNHLAFQVLKVKPGSVPVCNFLLEDTIVWAPGLQLAPMPSDRSAAQQLTTAGQKSQEFPDGTYSQSGGTSSFRGCVVSISFKAIEQYNGGIIKTILQRFSLKEKKMVVKE
ncbi:hypothetical protein LguiA_033029 [Lonicera macranthoides]